MAPNASPSSTLSTGTWKKKGVGRKADSLFAAVAALCGILVLLALAYMVISTTRTAFPVFRQEGISFVFGSDWDPSAGSYEILPFIYGTLITSIIALIIAVPMSIGVALFLSEYAPKWLRGPVEYAVDLLAAVPSVVYGLWGLLDRPSLFPAAGSELPREVPWLHTLVFRSVDRTFVFRGRRHPGDHDHPDHHLHNEGGLPHGTVQ